jgi:hypothetical protein
MRNLYFKGTVTYLINDGVNIIHLNTLYTGQAYHLVGDDLISVEDFTSKTELSYAIQDYLEQYHRYDQKEKLITMTFGGVLYTSENKYYFITDGYYFITDNQYQINKLLESNK